MAPSGAIVDHLVRRQSVTVLSLVRTRLSIGYP
nr:MAG TPA: hypothetical protein [Caudoviricetes sp.]